MVKESKKRLKVIYKHKTRSKIHTCMCVEWFAYSFFCLIIIIITIIINIIIINANIVIIIIVFIIIIIIIITDII